MRRQYSTSMSEFSKYLYQDIELTPNVFSELLVLLYTNKQFIRKDCIKRIMDYHVQHGGVCAKNEYISTFKRATESMRKKGYDLSNPANGVWRLKI